jgi:hypothetical protein
VAVVLLVLGGLLIGGAISLRRQRASGVVVAGLAAFGVLAAIGGALRL